MSRAEGLSVAWDYLSRATDGLAQSALILHTHHLDAYATTADKLREQTSHLRTQVRKEADAAHRTENPGAYDAAGQWIGKGQ